MKTPAVSSQASLTTPLLATEAPDPTVAKIAEVAQTVINYPVSTDPNQRKKYTGAVVDGLPHGRGELEWVNGDFYEGFFEKGVLHGKGRLVQRYGVLPGIWTGTWSNGNRNGLFEYTDNHNCCVPSTTTYRFEHGKDTDNGNCTIL